MSYVTPQMYGCVGDGVTDDTANLQTCLNSGNAILLVGKFKTTSVITVNLSASSTPAGLSIIGAGGNLSQIIFASTSCGITVNIPSYGTFPSEVAPTVVLRDFDFIPNVAGVSNPALTLSGAAVSGSSYPAFYIDHVNVVPSNANNYSSGGFLINNLSYGTIHGSTIEGGWAASGAAGFGIEFANIGGANSVPVNLKISDCSLAYWNIAINIPPYGPTSGQHDPEGVYIHHTDILACNTGVQAISNDQTGDWLQVHGCNISFGAFGVNAAGWSRVFVTDNYFLCQPNAISTGNSSVGIIVGRTAGPIFGKIIANHISFQNAISRYSTRIGVQTGGTNVRNIVHSNDTLNATTAFALAAGDQTTVGTGGGFAY